MHKRQKGNIGEDIAVKFLEERGFSIVGRNYLKRWGELDIIGFKSGILHFFEVKSVTVELFGTLDLHRPEDNVHGLKVKHLRRVIETYLEENNHGLDREFKFHVLCVFMDMTARKAKVKWIENIIL